jgi:hypothetical protein
MSLYDETLKLYYALRPGAINEYNKFILQQTPPEMQADMDGILAPNLPKLMLSDTQPVPVKDASGVDVPGSPGPARVTDEYSGHIELIIP